MTRTSTTDWGLLAMRLGFGALLIGFHGWTRLLRAFHYVAFGEPWTFVSLVQRLGFPFPPVFAVLSALSESIAVLFVVAGFYSRWASLFIVVNMSVAFYNEAAKGDPVELPALYLLCALVLTVTGAGALSVDRRRA